jgi:predicted outer membrane protein
MNARLSLSIAVSILLLSLSGCSTWPDTGTVAYGALTPMQASPEAAQFLSDTASLQHLDYAAGALAMTHATTPELRHYGAQITRDETFLLADLSPLAASLHVPIPTELDESAHAPLRNLADQQGLDFDRRYIDTMTANLSRELDAFRQAKGYDRDPSIKAFAARRIGLIQSHIDELAAFSGSN